MVPPFTNMLTPGGDSRPGASCSLATSYDGCRHREEIGVDVRIGIIQAPRELEIELSENESQEEVLEQIEKTLSAGEGVLWLTDKRGRRIGVPAARIGYIEIGEVDPRKVGFGAS
jgi:hypothetical protein